MSVIPLAAEEMVKWNQWLWRSHRLRELPGRIIYRCHLDFPMYLTPLRELPGIQMREERAAHADVLAFDLGPGTPTIATLWGDVASLLEPLAPLKDYEEAKGLLRGAALQGRLWWGTESLTDFPGMTSVCYLFPENFHFPVSAKENLRLETPSPFLETELDLV